MCLGAGVVKRCAAVREVSHRFPFLQTVGADIRVSHSDASEPVSRWANTFASLSEVRELSRPEKDEIVHAGVRKLSD
eukprot:750591-Rhodomonas_salina.1